MRSRKLSLGLTEVALAFAIAFGASGYAHAQRSGTHLSNAGGSRYVTFDPPGSTTTFALALNDSGQVAGGYYDSAGGHSFLRNSDGSFATFDPVGANYSTATSINNSGEVVGYWYNGTEFQSYYRSATGEITTFAGFAVGINDAGWIIGESGDNGFVRSPDGIITTFDAFGATLTYASSINKAGYISGEYTNTAGTDLFGYIRNLSGAFMSVSVPGSGAQGTTSTVINDNLEMAGSYTDSRGLNHGFVRSPSGVFTTFDVPTALITQAAQINDAGQIVGYADTRSSVNIGFLRSPSGTITAFQVPGAGLNLDEGTRSIVINASGTLAGYYFDTNRVPHGFLRF